MVWRPVIVGPAGNFYSATVAAISFTYRIDLFLFGRCESSRDIFGGYARIARVGPNAIAGAIPTVKHGHSLAYPRAFDLQARINVGADLQIRQRARSSISLVPNRSVAKDDTITLHQAWCKASRLCPQRPTRRQLE